MVVWPATREGMARALEAGRDADLIVKASGVGVFDAELEAGVLALRRPGNSWSRSGTSMRRRRWTGSRATAPTRSRP